LYLNQLYPEQKNIDDVVADIRADSPTSDASVVWLIFFLTDQECQRDRSGKLNKKRIYTKENQEVGESVQLTLDEYCDICTNIYIKWRRKLTNIDKYDREPLDDYVAYLYTVCRLWFIDEIKRVKAVRRRESERDKGKGKEIGLTPERLEVTASASRRIDTAFKKGVGYRMDDYAVRDKLNVKRLSKEACNILGEKSTNHERKNYMCKLRWAGYKMEGGQIVENPLTEKELTTELARLQTPESLPKLEQRRIKRLEEVTALLNKIKKKENENGHQITINEYIEAETKKRGRPKTVYDECPAVSSC
jgi:hypothetical protein